MNAKLKAQLEVVVESIVNSDTDAAKVAFNEYLRLKSQGILLGESMDDEECEEDKKDDKKVDKDLKDVEKDVKKAKKDQDKDDKDGEKADKDDKKSDKKDD
jgi:hypothetical protein